MLKQSLLDNLSTLRLSGFKEALTEQISNSSYSELDFLERLDLLLQEELLGRKNRRLKRRIKQARFKDNATMSDLDISLNRGLDKSEIHALSRCDWLRESQNIIITGATGVGKTFLATALGHNACKYDLSVRYFKTSRLLNTIKLSKADGSWSKMLDGLAKISLLILDDWFRDPLTLAQIRDLLEVFDDRWQSGSVILISQLPIENWHEALNDPTLADAILDRVLHNSFKIKMKGESKRKLMAKQKRINS